MTNHPTESGHWYTKDGRPAYETIGRNGLPRPTTLRDARKEGLVPSVTSIIRLAAAPGLENWKQDQSIMAALTLPRLEGENDTEFMARVKADSKEQAKRAAETGTKIHALVQEGFSTLVQPEGLSYYESARDTIVAECGSVNWACEQSFARDGYGGKADLHSREYLIDIKSTDKDLSTVKTWDEHAWQLSAYRYGLGIDGARCAILYIHVVTAESKLIWVEEKELQRGLQCFMALLAFWRAKNQIEETS